ncbi:phasin family protein [Sphingomonas profundi]|uniref:phasin family protein n=1 Tax=Alterirhizorhabdus profundi TaxID=2681549 RepID=UPI001E601DC8|nr:phasin family protein [Sphingomonas profundi]
MSEASDHGGKGGRKPPVRPAAKSIVKAVAQPAKSAAAPVVPAPEPVPVVSMSHEPAPTNSPLPAATIPQAPPLAAAPAKAEPAMSAIEVAAAPEPTLEEKIASAVAPVAPADEPAPLPDAEPSPVPAPAAAETTAAPTPVAAPEADPVATESGKPEPIVRPQTPSVAAFMFAPAMTKGLFDMATTFDSATAAPAVATEKMKAVFGGLNDRAKTAMEKSAKLGEEMTELTKGNVEALVASGKVAAKGAETMAQEAAEYGKKSFESATAMFKSLASAKSPTELFQLQSEFAKSSFDSAVAEASKLSEAWVKLAGEMVQPISNRYAVAAEKLKAAAL